MAEGIPELISRWDEVVRQLDLLRLDIHKTRLDGLVTIALVDGRIDMRGMGAIDTPEKAIALLLMAAHAYQHVSLGEARREARDLEERSRAVAAEAPLWDFSAARPASPPTPGSS